MLNLVKKLPQRKFSKLALAVLCASALAVSGCSSTSKTNNPNGYAQGTLPKSAQSNTYDEGDITSAISDHLGVTAENAASSIERMFKKQGRPVGYITGEEGGGAFIFGAKYGEGTLWMKDGRTKKVYWKGPTVGLDAGAVDNPDYIFRRFPGVDGSAFLVAGMAVHYERANGITLAPVRAGAGVRLGANIGYSSYIKKKPKGLGLIPI